MAMHTSPSCPLAVSFCASLSLSLCRIHKCVEGNDIANATGTAFPHTSHCLGSGEIMISTMGNNEGKVRQERWVGAGAGAEPVLVGERVVT